MFQDRKFKIFISSFLTIVATCLVIYLWEAITRGNIYEGIFVKSMYNKLPSTIGNIPIRRIGTVNMDPMPFGMGFIYSIIGIRNIIYSILIAPISSLITGGLLHTFYRKIAYEEEVEPAKIFCLFKNNFFRNYLVVALIGICTALGTFLLIIPGIILGLGFYSWSILAGEETNSDKSAIEIIKMTWENTRGFKSEIFIKKLKWGLILVLINIVPYMVLFVLANMGAFFSIIATLLLIIIIIPLFLLLRTIMFISDIEIIMEMVNIRKLPLNTAYEEEENIY